MNNRLTVLVPGFLVCFALASCSSTPDSSDLQQAISRAESRIQTNNYSQFRLEEWLTTNAGGNFSKEVAQQAVKQLDVDWAKQAEQSAYTYIVLLGFSPDDAYTQMTSPYGERFPSDITISAIEKNLNT